MPGVIISQDYLESKIDKFLNLHRYLFINQDRFSNDLTSQDCEMIYMYGLGFLEKKETMTSDTITSIKSFFIEKGGIKNWANEHPSLLCGPVTLISWMIHNGYKNEINNCGSFMYNEKNYKNPFLSMRVLKKIYSILYDKSFDSKKEMDKRRIETLRNYATRIELTEQLRKNIHKLHNVLRPYVDEPIQKLENESDKDFDNRKKRLIAERESKEVSIFYFLLIFYSQHQKFLY